MKNKTKKKIKKTGTQFLLELMKDEKWVQAYRKDDDFEIFKEHMKILAKK